MNTNRIAAWHPALRVRRNEPLAYQSTLSKIFEFNEDGDRVLRLVDGRRTIGDILSELANGDERIVAVLAARCEEFLERCVREGALVWKL